MIKTRLTYVIAFTVTVFGMAAIHSARTSPAAAAPTFSKDVAPILFKSCASCHRPGEIAPMSLLTYENARPWHDKYRGIMNIQLFDPGVNADGILPNTKTPVITRPGKGDFYDGLNFHFSDGTSVMPQWIVIENLGFSSCSENPPNWISEKPQGSQVFHCASEAAIFMP